MELVLALEKARRGVKASPGQGAFSFDEEAHPRQAKGEGGGQYKPGEFVPRKKNTAQQWAHGLELPVDYEDDLPTTAMYSGGRVKVNSRQAEILRRHKRYGASALDAVITHEKMHHLWHLAVGDREAGGNPAWRAAIEELETIPKSEGVDVVPKGSLAERAVETLTVDTLAPDRLSEAERAWCDRIKEQAHRNGTSAPSQKNPAVLATYENEEDGTRVHVAQVPKGFSVSLQDVESGEYIPQVSIYPTREQADAAARKAARVPEAAAEEPKPWELAASGYLSRKGVHEPWIAEISPMQMGHLSGRQKKAYQEKRQAEWAASGQAKEEWGRQILEAHDRGEIGRDSPELHPEARRELVSRLLAREKAGQKATFDEALKANRITSMEQIEVGARLFDQMTNSYGVVTKKNRNTVRFKPDRPLYQGAPEEYKTGPGSLMFQKYDDLQREHGLAKSLLLPITLPTPTLPQLLILNPAKGVTHAG